MALVECRLSKVVMSESHDRQVIVLEEVNGTRKFPILIGLTHELIGNICRGLNVTLERVIINDLREMTFYARLILKQNGRTVDVDSRPSDAIALAVQMGAPVFVEEEVIEKASRDDA